MRTVFIVLILVLLVASFGCKTASHSVTRNCNFFMDDVIRFAGLDKPSDLYSRDMEPWDAYVPYHGYP